MVAPKASVSPIRKKFDGLGVTLTDDQIIEIEQKLFEIDLSTLIPPNTPSIDTHRKNRTQ